MKKPDGGSAFPLFDGSAAYGGMSLRDWYAGMALNGIKFTTYIDGMQVQTTPESVAKLCFNIADAMIKAGEE